MEVKYSSISQDVNVFLSRPEFDDLTSKLDTNFLDSCLKVASKEAGAHFFLGYGQLGAFFNDNAKQVTEENGIQLLNPIGEGSPYYIRLLPEAVNALRVNNQIGMRMIGGFKLTISIKEELK
jgi:hypothetical protein